MAWRTALLLWLPRLSITTMSPGCSVGTRNCSTHARKRWPLIGPLKRQGASRRSGRSAARKVRVRQRPWGAVPIRRWPRGPQPRKGAMLVLAQVSSTNTSRAGSTPAWRAFQRARRRATSGRSRSLANAVFFEAQPRGMHEVAHRAVAHPDAPRRQRRLKAPKRQFRRRRIAGLDPGPVRFQKRPPVAAELGRRDAPRRPAPLRPLRDRRRRNAEHRRNSPNALARLMASHNTLTKIVRQRSCHACWPPHPAHILNQNLARAETPK